MAKKKQYTEEEILDLVKKAAIRADEKAIDIKILDLRKLTSMTDYFVICTGEVGDHVKAIEKAVEKGLIESDNFKAWHIEGYSNANWVVMDYFDFIVHIFTPESREYYNLEKLWISAPEIEM